MERRSLGRGLGALIPDRQEKEGQFKIVNVQTDLIKPNPFQPRDDFDVQGLEELAQSIKEKGVIQPILVRRTGEQYELIAGERRLRACKALGYKEVPAIVRDTEDKDSLELSLIENIQRQNLNAIEEAHAYQYLLEKYQVTQEKISEALGKSRVSITNMLRLLKLPQEIQEEIKTGRISYGHGRALLEIEDVNLQRRLVQDVITNSLSVRELENIIKTKRLRIIKSRITPQSREPFLAVMQEDLQHVLGTKVRINRRRKTGTIIIDFYSDEDLQRIVNKIKGGSIL